jgi:hypothetical protein
VISHKCVIKKGTVFIASSLSFQKEVRDLPSSYIQNPSSMVELTYKSVFFVARKPVTPATPATPATGMSQWNGGGLES